MLYRKLVQMSERIRQLEEALHVRLTPGEQHPLLREELLNIKNGLHDVGADGSTNGPTAPEDETISMQLHENFGTLAITDGGATRFIGVTGSSEARASVLCLYSLH